MNENDFQKFLKIFLCLYLTLFSISDSLLWIHHFEFIKFEIYDLRLGWYENPSNKFSKYSTIVGSSLVQIMNFLSKRKLTRKTILKNTLVYYIQQRNCFIIHYTQKCQLFSLYRKNIHWNKKKDFSSVLNFRICLLFIFYLLWIDINDAHRLSYMLLHWIFIQFFLDDSIPLSTWLT